jgi:ribosomal-protein-alanine N-acetyltransferase
MTETKIPVRDNFYLSAVTLDDKTALLEHLRVKDIHDTTMNIPFPYSEADADWWLGKRVGQTLRHGKEVTFAIRDNGKLIGVVGADSFEVGESHRAEIGYWLAKPYWGRGLMTDVVRAYIHYAFREFELERLTAHVFEFNQASARVLEKNGFTLEGRLRRHFLKNGELIDGRLYGLLKEDVGTRKK